MRGCVDAWMCGWMCGCVDAWMCGCVDVWMRGCVDVWMRGCVDVTYVYGSADMWICGCLGGDYHVNEYGICVLPWVCDSLWFCAGRVCAGRVCADWVCTGMTHEVKLVTLA